MTFRTDVTDVTVTFTDGTTESYHVRAGCRGGRIDHVKTYVEADSKKITDRRDVERIGVDIPVAVGTRPDRTRLVVTTDDLAAVLTGDQDTPAARAVRARLAVALLAADVTRIALEPATVPG